MVLPAYADPPSGTVSANYVGSVQQYQQQVMLDLIEQHAAGTLDYSQFTTGTGGIGQPGPGGTGVVTPQTALFFQNYVQAMVANNDPGLVNMYGAPPTQVATFTQDPNSPSAIATQNNTSAATLQAQNLAAQQAMQAQSLAAQQAMNAQDNAAQLQAAGIQAGATIQGAQISAQAQLAAAQLRASTDLQISSNTIASNERMNAANIQANWSIAVLNDATNRWIAEGNWGVQRYVAELQEAGMTSRLQLELGYRREELAQRALEEKNRQQESMIGLALEVAKYDAELGASPRNWLKYAAWLRGRDIVVNGLSLAMAAQEVPDDAIDPATVVEVTGNNLAGIQTAQEVVSGESGGSASTQDAFGAQTAPLAGPGAGTTQAQLNQYVQPPTPEQLGSTTDYSDLARRLMGMNPAGTDPTDASAENLQNISNSLRTNIGDQPLYEAWKGPTVNALGMDRGEEVSGQGVDYRKFTQQLTPVQQQMKLGEIESVRGEAGVQDWFAEMDRARPKGRTGSFTAGYG